MSVAVTYVKQVKGQPQEHIATKLFASIEGGEKGWQQLNFLMAAIGVFGNDAHGLMWSVCCNRVHGDALTFSIDQYEDEAIPDLRGWPLLVILFDYEPHLLPRENGGVSPSSLIT